MTWPRFRGRNGLDLRPNYYFSDGDWPELDHARHERYLSGELDRMVHGWWLSPHFQQAVAERAGITVDQVQEVQRAMLEWDDIPFGGEL